MKKLLIAGVLAGLAWHGYGKYVANSTYRGEPSEMSAVAQEEAVSVSFKCDGRTHCSQMTSCAEATYFLRSCPGTQMDGNNDGVPCEKQWCR